MKKKSFEFLKKYNQSENQWDDRAASVLPNDTNKNFTYFDLDGKTKLTKQQAVDKGSFLLKNNSKNISVEYGGKYGKNIPNFDKFVKDEIPFTTVIKEGNNRPMTKYDSEYALLLQNGMTKPSKEIKDYIASKGVPQDSINAKFVESMRKELKLTWHEPTTRSAQLIPTEINSTFKHAGGWSRQGLFEWMRGFFDKKQNSSRPNKLFGGIGAVGAASGSNVNWGKIITSIIAVLVVLALIVGVVVLLAKILPPVFEAIGNFFANIGRAIGNFFSSIGQFFVNIWNGIVGFFSGPAPGIDVNMPNLGDLGDDVGNILDGFKPELNKYELEFATDDGGKTYYVSNCNRTLLGTTDTNLQIEIPETHNGSPVVGIGEKAFMYMSHIKALKIPRSIKWIEYNAFGSSYSHCAHIKELHITDIKAWLSIEFGPNSGEYAILEYAHPFCGVGEEYRDDYETTGKEAGKFYLNGELVTNLIIPDGVTEIGELAFLNCSSIETITIPSSVTHIGDNAFYCCINLESITFGGTQNEWNKCCGEYLFSYPCTIKCKDGNILITVE